MKRKNKVFALVAATALVSALTACGGHNNEPAPGGDGKAGGGRTDHLTIWYRPGSLPSAAVEGAQAAFPDTKLEFVKSGDVDTKLDAALRVKQGLPDITTADPVKLSSAESKFVDANTAGLGDAAKAYLEWKLKSGQVNGHQVGIPIDIGPAGFYYNAVEMKKLGLPDDPAEVGKEVSTWDGYRQLATKVKESGKFACDDPGYLYYYDLLRRGFDFYTEDGKYTPEGEANKAAFSNALTWKRDGLCANLTMYSTDWSSGMAKGGVIAFLNPPWIASSSLPTAAPKQAGQWRLATATPDGAASEDGSMLMMPKTDADPALQVKVATWLTNAKNQAAGYAKDGLFPSTPESFKMPELSKGAPYFGNQQTGIVLGDLATKAPTVRRGKNSGAVSTVYGKAVRETKDDVSIDDAYAATVAKVQEQFPVE